jgi:hypothetical protein
MKGVSDFAAGYGLGLELSLLNPIEIGKAYSKATGESGRWVQYITDLRDPETGGFSTMVWEHLAWSNNKGKVRPQRSGIRAFAYKAGFSLREGYRVVRPGDIREITAEIVVEVLPGTKFPESQSFEAQRIRIYCEGDDQWKGYNRVFVLISYKVPEMDYFSPGASNYLKNLVDQYHAAGINLNALWSDEVHIQQDWVYHAHHDRGQFNIRYLTDNFARNFAALYGKEYTDMDRMMIYFVYGPETYSHAVSAAQKNVQIVMGDTPEEIQRTFLFRDRYYKMLNNQVVDLFLGARRYAESRFGRELPTRHHATWAESPTCDFWDTRELHDDRYKYEYTPNFVWSNTVHQAAAAAYDYFKWGEYLTAMGTDHTEGGTGDRNYYAAALASSFAMVNEYPNAYNGAWGMPPEVRIRNISIFSAYGASNSFPTMSQVTERVHRDVEVLMLYPMNLVASEERFGSWMTQYGYANYLTAEKLLEKGKLTDEGRILVEGRGFNTLVALFETFPAPELLDLMENHLANGGTVIWSGPPPLLYNTGEPCLDRWENLFGVDYVPLAYQGVIAPGKKVSFLGRFDHIPDQVIMTDFLVDHTYPVEPRQGSEVVARVNEDIVGTVLYKGSGKACFLGFRPRDDQAQSLGYEQRSWFEILDALGAYPPTGTFAGINDNTEHLSRTTDYLCTRFPNGTTVIARHFRTHPENWPGRFGYDPQGYKEYLEVNPLPSSKVVLERFKVNGHKISYSGDLLVAFRLEGEQLRSFDGRDCRQITIDGTVHQFAAENLRHIAWTPVAEVRQLPGGAFFQIYAEGAGEIEVPLQTSRNGMKLYAEGKIIGTAGKEIPFEYTRGSIRLTLDDENTGRWLYLTGK